MTMPCKWNLWLPCLISFAVVAESWLPTRPNPRPLSWTRQTGPGFQGTLRASSGSSSNNDSTGVAKDLFLVSWEGCLADTVQWRTEEGIAVCQKVWPDLEVLLADDDDCQWLYNKVRALHHVLVLDPQYSPTVEYALLIRMLLEEQELDQGRSNGSRGKYGSKYHPRAGDAFSAADDEPSFNKRKQRPLTVGEIASNWQDSLREAVLIRYYHEEGQNPLDLLQLAVNQREVAPRALAWKYSKDIDVLRDHCDSIIVTVPHSSDLVTVRASLDDVKHAVYESIEDAMAVPRNTLAVVCRSKQLVRETLETLPADSSVSVLESSWSILQKNILVFGDCVPRQTDRPQPCSVDGRNLQLSLWRSVHPDDQAAALMNAWAYCREETEWPTALQPVSTRRR
eukprot:scaffold1162_cov170-Amphora_coffeaeformis.AAC.6